MDQEQFPLMRSKLRSIEKKLDSASETLAYRIDSNYSQGVIRQELGRINMIQREILDFLRYICEVQE